MGGMLIDGIKVKCREEIYSEGLVRKNMLPDRTVPLSHVLEEYLLKLGHSSDHVLAIVLRLLTHGKVRVEFRHCRDRLELTDMTQLMSRSSAIQLFDEFLSRVRDEETRAENASNMTQRIVVQSGPSKKVIS